jgi:hypothetical protein
MKLAQGQIWKKSANYYRIVKWARLAIEFKESRSLASGGGTLQRVTKKEFCRLIKGAELIGTEGERESDSAPDLNEPLPKRDSL